MSAATPTKLAQEIYQAWPSQGAQVVSEHDFAKTGLSYSAFFAPNMVSEAGRTLYEAGYFLEDVSVMKVKEGFVATYHYATVYEPGIRLAIRALSPNGVFTSLNSVYQGAEWHERESTDFFGVQFIGNPNPVPLLTDPDSPDTSPLIKPDKELATMATLKLFGKTTVCDPTWETLVNPDAQKEPAA